MLLKFFFNFFYFTLTFDSFPLISIPAFFYLVLRFSSATYLLIYNFFFQKMTTTVQAMPDNDTEHIGQLVQGMIIG